ncbi:MAG: transferase [Verrucomicrobia bacterium]|nr:MAG: transferase [Verrucomicrobiota bacterium]
MKQIVLFGTGKIAEVLLYFLRNESDYEVVACTVHRTFLPGDTWQSLPVVAFDEVERLYPPATHAMFVALGYQELNALRARTCAEAKEKGYALVSYVHPQSGLPADCEYGENCFIMNNVLVHPRVRLGNNVFVWSGAMIGHHSTIGDHCWLTSCANISGVVTVGKSCFFAVNATVGHNVVMGDECFVGANALVTKCAENRQVFLFESTKPFRLDSHQFLRMSKFADL